MTERTFIVMMTALVASIPWIVGSVGVWLSVAPTSEVWSLVGLVMIPIWSLAAMVIGLMFYADASYY